MSATILVVENDEDVAACVEGALVDAGFLVPALAASGSEAIACAERMRPALALMDIELDGPIDGIDTAAILRERFGLRVVYLTGLTDDATLRRAKATAPLGYLKKPFNVRELRIAVELALHQAGLEAAVAEREKWFSTTLQSIGDAVVTTDADARVTFMNRTAEAMLSVRAAEVIGTRVDDVVRLVDAKAARLALPSRRRGDDDAPAKLPRGARLATAGVEPGFLEVEGSIAPIGSGGDDSLGSVMVLVDVTERRLLERRLGVSERLATIGTMAAGMQHEINNPLATVVANVQFALDVLRAQKAHSAAAPSPEDLAELVSALEDAAVGAERVRRTVEELRHFSSGPESSETSIEMSVAIDDAIRLTAHAVRHHAAVRREYGTAPRVRAEEGQLARVFMNLLLYAAQATGDGRAGDHCIVVSTRTDASGRAVAEVGHDGWEMADDAIHRIFEPFYATPVEKAANGLGLAVCHSIITSLGGEIDVSSTVGQGTTFRVTLPPASPASRAPRAADGPKPPSSRARGASARARILVVDDEIAIGKAIRRILNREHHVTLEPDARAALQRLETETYDVVFCDLMMPNMSGMEFFDELAARSPQVAERIVFVTGGAFSPRSVDFLKRIRNECIAKPFSREDVATAVRRLMARP